ncbi:hypothetical protein CAEBREN_16077 [Caenorhabditis brenneri]|uniref:Uncharacterized protein n=1 Tax=Caenorhabditis brenneri TaxID=135651 RepID=G0P9E4_CAEBE|nr:hypothetical protein CAEBREN_16077 [Caenorhabditis brenneri]
MNSLIVQSLLRSVGENFDTGDLDISTTVDIETMLKALPRRIQDKVMPLVVTTTQCDTVTCRIKNGTRTLIPYIGLDLESVYSLKRFDPIVYRECANNGCEYPQTKDHLIGEIYDFPNSFIAIPSLNKRFNPSTFHKMQFHNNNCAIWLVKYVFFYNEEDGSVCRVKPKKWNAVQEVDVHAVILVRGVYCPDCYNVRPMVDSQRDVARGTYKNL